MQVDIGIEKSRQQQQQQQGCSIIFHHPTTSFCSNILLTDSSELAHLPGYQASSAESFSAPTQSKMGCLNGFPFLRQYTGVLGEGTFIYFFMTQITGWTLYLCRVCWLSIHLLLNLVRLARHRGSWMHPLAITRILMESLCMVFKDLVRGQPKYSMRS